MKTKLRRVLRYGAALLVAQSATSSFQRSWAPEQHASLAALRARVPRAGWSSGQNTTARSVQVRVTVAPPATSPASESEPPTVTTPSIEASVR